VTVSLGIKRLLVYSESLLIDQQVNKERDINNDTMDAYVMEIHKLEIHKDTIFIYIWKIHSTRTCSYSHMCICCWSKPTGEQRQATLGAGRLPGRLVGPDPSVNGLGSATRPSVWVARRAT
jgi:hypothetical protein